MEENCFRRTLKHETCLSYSRIFQRRNHVNSHLIQHLQLESVLEGHSGCVNCLDWNAQGTLLASGSDDTNIILWDAFRHKSVHLLSTQHHGNIFSVKFMPCTGDKMLATGAADCHIFVHDLVGKETVCAYNVEGRVKRLVNTSAEPNILISAAEDGMVREYDIRESSASSDKVLVDLTDKCSGTAECKCVAISPTNPNCIAVGATDPYVRIYDRRMPNMQKNAMYFIPGHLRSKQNEQKRPLRNLCVTYLAFNPSGNEVLVNLGGEQIYIYDINSRLKPLLLDTKIRSKCNGVKKHSTDEMEEALGSNFEHVPKRSKNSAGSSSHRDNTCVKNGKTVNPFGGKFEPKSSENPLVDRYRLKGNELFVEQKYSAAISMYNKAIALSPRSVTYSNRAAALIKREWNGDFYAALKDCYSALQANPSDVKAHYRLARCMFELKWFDEASRCIKEFKSHHPEHSNSNACVALEKDIKVALRQKENGSKKSKAGPDLSADETSLRTSCYDYKYRYCGHCNTTTDIKEANFFGDNGQYIVAGSDEGSFFIWERETTNLVRVMQADSSIVNCLQPHPSVCMLATSGIDTEVKLWSPKLQDCEQKNVMLDIDAIAAENQKRMNADPLESMLISMGMRFVSSDDDNSTGEVMPCRTN